MHSSAHACVTTAIISLFWQARAFSLCQDIHCCISHTDILTAPNADFELGCIQIFHKVSKVAVDQLNHQRLKHHLALDEVSIACTNASTAYT